MRKTMFKALSLVALVLFTSCTKEVVSKSAKSTSISNASAPIMGTIIVDETSWNSCTEEDVHLTGTLKYVIHYTEVNGVTHYHESWTETLKGEGLTSGTKYVGSFTQEFSGMLTEEDYPVALGTTRLKLNSSRGSITLKQFFQLIEGPDGTARVLNVVNSYECK